MRKLILFILITSPLLNYSQANCQNLQIFCPTTTYSAGVNTGNGQVGPNYGCLGSQPNPAWFYLNIGLSGSIQISLSAMFDIDFICYGPFTSASGNCNNLTALNFIDCSYSGSNSETLTISNATAGQYYVFMVTNYSNASQLITMNQVAGTGSLSCYGFPINANAICLGSISTITASPPPFTSPSYSLNPGSITSSTPGFTVSPTSNNVYTLFCTGINSLNNLQTITSTVNVTIYPSTTLTTFVSTPTICLGDSATLFVNGAITYTWSNGFITSNTSNIVTPTVTTTYTVSGVSMYGCVDTTQITLNVVNCIVTGKGDNLASKNKFILFPNPTNDILNIESEIINGASTGSATAFKIEIINALGQLIREEEITFKENKTTISTQNLPNGVYVLTLLDTPPSSATRSDKMQSASKRFVVAR